MKVRGEGSVTPLEDKPRAKCRKWRLRVSSGEKDPKTGKYKPPYSRNFQGMYREAKAALRAFIEEIERGEVVGRSGMTFEQYSQAWLEKRKNEVESSTWEKDEGQVKALNYHLGSARLEDITDQMIEDTFAAIMSGDTLSGKVPSGTYANMLAVTLSKILKRAKKDKLIPFNPCQDFIAPKIDTAEKKALRFEDIVALTEKLDPCLPPQLSILFSLRTGIRRGETCALVWKDIDFKNKTVSIRHASKKRGEVGKTKTPASVRKLPLPSSMVPALLKRKRYIAKEFELIRLKTGSDEPRLTEETPILCSPLGESYKPHAVTRWWDRNRKALGFEGWAVHEMRHSYLSEMARRKTEPKTLQKLAGHAKFSTTMDIYVHVGMEEKEEAVAVVDW